MTEKKWNPRDWSQQPTSIYPDYKSTSLRNPKSPLIKIDLPENMKGPSFMKSELRDLDADLTKNAKKSHDPIGERIVVIGQVKDEYDRPVRNCLIEIWQANSAGRYIHREELHDAPLDPNFHGAGMTLTDDNGFYKFTTIKPGAYPWGNHKNAWRPAHIHFSLIGRGFVDRLITQMYFEGDPLFAYDPIFNSIPDKKSRSRLIAKFSIEKTIPEFAHAYVFDIVLRGKEATPMESN
jgi:protocatechuate 3,4-dioxygenase beta subunit